MKSMTTYSGVSFDPFKITVKDINIYDIAHSLSMINRWVGHTKIPYSVARHSICVSRYPALKTDRQRLAALLHDAAEAYCGDIATPIKDGIPAFREMEDKILATIFKRFDIGDLYPLSEVIHAADKLELRREAESLGLKKIRGRKPREEYGYEMDHVEISKQFMERFLELGGKI